MKILSSMLTILTCTACQTQAPYATRPGTTDYFHPVRAQIEEHGKIMTCSGFVGRNEEGAIVVSLKPVDHYWEGMLGFDDMYIHQFQWEADAEFGYSMRSSWVDEKKDFLLSSLIAADLRRFELVHRNLPWALLLHEFPDQLVLEPNAKEWRVTRSRGGFDEVIIFGAGGPWRNRPEGSFRVLEEPAPGSFTLDGIELILPYWRIFDERGMEPLDPEIVHPRAPH